MVISQSELSVVVQGPVRAWTDDVLRSVRRHLPEAELVLSSYEDPAGLDRFGADVVVVNDDVGSVDVRPSQQLVRKLNLNRMISTTQAGLRAGRRRYALKLRSDSPLTSDLALRWLDAVPPGPPHRLFEQRIATTMGAGTWEGTYLYSVPDLVQVGLRTDLLDLWSLDLVDESALADYWTNQGKPPANPARWNIRYTCEQVVWLDFLRRHGVDVDYPFNGAPCRPGELEASLRILVANVVMLDSWQLGAAFPKLGINVNAMPLEMRMGFADWLRLERLYHGV